MIYEGLTDDKEARSMEQIRTTIRMPSRLLEAIEKVRDPEEFPTVSDFIRRAVEQFVREQRRRQLAEECRRLAGEEDLTALADSDLADYAEKMGRAERGEL
jgi:Arc/MetJ-type ribon-helix-helix transcriptional regulator